MSVTLDLPTEIENELSAEAARFGLPLREHILRLLSGMLKPNNKPRTGAELVEYWRSEGLIGTRSDIADSQARAREIHSKAERALRSICFWKLATRPECIEAILQASRFRVSCRLRLHIGKIGEVLRIAHQRKE